MAAPGDDDVLSRLLEAFDAKPLQGSKQTREKRFEANIHLMKQVLVSEARPASRWGLWGRCLHVELPVGRLMGKGRDSALRYALGS